MWDLLTLEFIFQIIPSISTRPSAARGKMFVMYSTYPELEQQVNRTDIPD